jgi:hypothetical protein
MLSKRVVVASATVLFSGIPQPGQSRTVAIREMALRYGAKPALSAAAVVCRESPPALDPSRITLPLSSVFIVLTDGSQRHGSQKNKERGISIQGSVNPLWLLEIVAMGGKWSVWPARKSVARLPPLFRLG